MHIFRKVNTLQAKLAQCRTHGLSIGFVPTMGALHEGHMSLIQRAKSISNICVASIFVNPTQFNDAEDLTNYPRTLREDVDLLIDNGCDILFFPRDEEVYPEGLETNLSLDFGKLTEVLEGEFRPGHFDGMAQVVSRLLDIVAPDQLYMGQKDYQQFTIVRDMIGQQKRSTELVVCPIMREDDGLAMSSRNRRLTPHFREKAVILSQCLKNTLSRSNIDSIELSEKTALNSIEKAGLKPEYFKIVDGINLTKVKDITQHKEVVACLAAWAGDIRLIDNMILTHKEE